MLFSSDDLKTATGGVIVREGGRPVRGVSIDSRDVQAGELFVPLRGERVNGHNFIPEALTRGAAAVVVEKNFLQSRPELQETIRRADGCTWVEVTDTLAALQDLARFHMDRFPSLIRIGITGSSGKTTTKELIGAIFSSHTSVMVSKGNLNSEIGVPLSAFAVTSAHAYAVFEMGINHPGEMDVLAAIVKPDLAVITNIGTAHIGLLGSREKIAAEKKKIANFFDAAGVLFVFENEEYLEYLRKDIRGKIIRYGPHRTQGLKGSQDLGLDGTAIDWEGLRIRFPLVGAFNYRNALAAISVASYCRIPSQRIKKGLENVRPFGGRSEIIRGGITVINDCYNANPDSVTQALQFLAGVEWRGRRLAVLGSMRELGDESDTLHREIGQTAGRLPIDACFFYGEEMFAAFQAIKETSYRGIAEFHTDFSSLVERVTGVAHQGDLVLIKGSRAMELERLVGPLA